MKIRKSYVSNSSSSSYVCDVCGDIQSGWDSSSLSDFGLVGCTRYHILCEPHVEVEERCKVKHILSEIEECIDDIQDLMAEHPLEFEQLKSADPDADIYDALDDSNFIEILLEFLYDDYYGPADTIPRSLCPICTMESISNHDRKEYIKQKFQLTNSEIDDEIKKSFDSYTDFMHYLCTGVKDENQN